VGSFFELEKIPFVFFLQGQFVFDRLIGEFLQFIFDNILSD